jgi:hypothetical protein
VSLVKIVVQRGTIQSPSPASLPPGVALVVSPRGTLLGHPVPDADGAVAGGAPQRLAQLARRLALVRSDAQQISDSCKVTALAFDPRNLIHLYWKKVITLIFIVLFL